MSKRVKFAAYTKFNEGFNNLPADDLPPNCQQILRCNGSPILIDATETSIDDIKFFVYPFADKEMVKVPILPSTKDSLFGLKLQFDDLYGRTYIKELSDTKSLSSAKVFGNIKRSQNKLHGAFITDVDGVPVISVTQATEQLTLLYNQWKKAKKQGVEQEFSFEITFA